MFYRGDWAYSDGGNTNGFGPVYHGDGHDRPPRLTVTIGPPVARVRWGPNARGAVALGYGRIATVEARGSNVEDARVRAHEALTKIAPSAFWVLVSDSVHVDAASGEARLTLSYREVPKVKKDTKDVKDTSPEARHHEALCRKHEAAAKDKARRVFEATAASGVTEALGPIVTEDVVRSFEDQAAQSPSPPPLPKDYGRCPRCNARLRLSAGLGERVCLSCVTAPGDPVSVCLAYRGPDREMGTPTEFEPYRVPPWLATVGGAVVGVVVGVAQGAYWRETWSAVQTLAEGGWWPW